MAAIGSNALSYPMYKDFRDRNQVFSGVFCRFGLPLSLGYKGQTERVEGELVSWNYFDVLGVKAALGRTFAPDDDRLPGAHPLAVLSYDFWVNRFASDPNLLGQTLIINGHSMTVIGVSQKGFHGIELGYSPKIRIPVMMNRQMMAAWSETYNLDNRRGRWVNVFGRLRADVTREQAQASLQPLFHSILEMEVREKGFATATSYTKEQFLKSRIEVLPGAQGRSRLREQLSTPLWVLMALVGLVLLIACANLANLLLARAIGREKEIAVRLALGAGRFRIVSQLLAESLLLSGLGGTAGLLVAVWANRLLLQFIPTGDTPLILSTTPDLRILGFALMLSTLTGILFGLAPALQATRVSLTPSLKEQVGSIAGSPHARFRKLLVVVQVCLSLLLLIGAGLFIRSLQNLKNLDPGFRTHNIIAFSMDPNLNGYPKERSLFFYRDLINHLQSLPGAESAALALVRVLDDNEWDSTISVEGYEPKPGEDMNPYFNAVSPGYFATLGLPLRLGREFLPTDEAGRQKVAIVNEKFARRYFGDRNPIGRRIGFGGDPGTKTDIVIVGIIEDAKYMNMREAIREQVFVTYQQQDWVIEMTAYVRTQADPKQMFAAIRRTVHDLDPNLPVFSLRTLELQLDQSLATEGLIAILASIFGILATILATIGLYGVMAYNVARRTRK